MREILTGPPALRLAVLVPATAVTLLVSGLAVSISLGRALRPLEALDVETRRVADAGDHEARIVGRYRDDEIGALAGSVDSMLASLADKHHEGQESTRIQREFLADVIDCTGLDPIANVVVSGNSDHLTQVFDALLDNAVKFTPPSGRIELIGRGIDDTVVIEVCDTGVGIGAIEIDKVFDRFYKGHDGGTGLGLAIARHLVEQHGGTISATSPPAGGTTVRVELPLL